MVRSSLEWTGRGAKRGGSVKKLLCLVCLPALLHAQSPTPPPRVVVTQASRLTSSSGVSPEPPGASRLAAASPSAGGQDARATDQAGRLSYGRTIRDENGRILGQAETTATGYNLRDANGRIVEHILKQK